MVQSAPVETVTRLDAAERQLRVAIRMLFERKDMIAVHTLAAAALDILRQLGRPRGFKTFYESIDERILPEKRNEVRALVRKAQNFFKHAGRDPGEELEFYYSSTPFFIHAAARLAHQLMGSSPPECTVFMLWYALKNPNDFLPDEASREAEATLAEVVDLDNFEHFLFVIDHYPKLTE